MNDEDRDFGLAILGDLCTKLKTDIPSLFRIITCAEAATPWIEIWPKGIISIITIFYFEDEATVGVNTGRIAWQDGNTLGKEQIIMFSISDPEYPNKIINLLKEIINGDS